MVTNNGQQGSNHDSEGEEDDDGDNGSHEQPHKALHIHQTHLEAPMTQPCEAGTNIIILFYR